MRAIVCHEPGGLNNLKFDYLPGPIANKDEVTIEIYYAGVNYPDVLIAEGRYQFQPKTPFAPGGEISGIVKTIGANVKKLKVGDRVCAVTSWGGFAETVSCRESNVFRLPENVGFKQASILLETYATAYHGLKDRALLKENETICVIGAAGGTGTACIQIARQMGAEVIAICSTGVKCDFAKSQGAHIVINSSEVDIKAQLKSLGGVDVIFDPVGGDVSEACFRAIKPGGRHLVVGFASGKVPKMPWNLPLLKRASIVGVFWGGFWRNSPDENAKNVKVLLNWLSTKTINPAISRLFEFEEAVQALEELKNRSVIGKNVLKIRSAD